MTALRHTSLAALLLSPILIACVGDTASTQPQADGGADVSVPVPDGGSADGARDAAPDVAPACGTAGQACCSGNVCNGGATCNGTTCACPQAQVACSATCTDLQTDGKNCGACGHDCLGGACTAGKCEATTLVTGQASVNRLVPTATKLYWSRGKTSTQNSGVFFSDLDGKNPAPLYGTSGYCGAVTVSSTHVYFACDSQIARCTLGSCGSGPTPLLTQTNLGDLAFDGTNDRVYFTVITPYNTQAGGFVASIPAAGGAYSRLATADQATPSALVIDAGIVYWLNAGTYLADNPKYDGGVKKAPLGVNQSVNIVASDISGTDYASLAVQGGVAYWTGTFATGQIHSVSTIGGAASTYTPTVSPSGARNVIADASYVYWIENAGNVYRCEKTCVKPTLIATASQPATIAQDDKSIYFATYNGDIRRLAK